MELFIGLAVVAAVVVLILGARRNYTSNMYERHFGVWYKDGTWQARETLINKWFGERLQEERELDCDRDSWERRIQRPRPEDYTTSLFDELNSTLKDMRRVRKEIEYACKLVARREGKFRARWLLGDNDQWRKPTSLQRRERPVLAA